MIRNLKALSKAILTQHLYSEINWLGDLTETNIHFHKLNRLTKTNRPLALDAIQLAGELVMRCTEMDNKDNYGPLCIGLGFTSTVMKNAATSGHFSKKTVLEGYENVLSLMKSNQHLLAPSHSYNIFRRAFNDMFNDATLIERGKELPSSVCRPNIKTKMISVPKR